MNDIRSVLFAKNINLELKASTKRGIVEEMVQMLYQNGHISDQEVFVDEILFRETEGITGIGNGIAIPHGRSEVVKDSVIAIGRTDKVIDWETFDDVPVQCIIMFAVRNLDMSKHIILLSQAAQLLLDEDVIDILLHSNSKNEIMNVFHKEGS